MRRAEPGTGAGAMQRTGTEEGESGRGLGASHYAYEVVTVTFRFGKSLLRRSDMEHFIHIGACQVYCVRSHTLMAGGLAITVLSQPLTVGSSAEQK